MCEPVTYAQAEALVRHYETLRERGAVVLVDNLYVLCAFDFRPDLSWIDVARSDRLHTTIYGSEYTLGMTCAEFEAYWRKRLTVCWPESRTGDKVPLIVPDYPEADCTEAAHPAWWRGNDWGVISLCHDIQALLDGKPLFGTCDEPWESTRRRIAALRDAAKAPQFDGPEAGRETGMSETYTTTNYYIEHYAPDSLRADDTGWLRCYDVHEYLKSALANAASYRDRWGWPHRVVRVVQVTTETVVGQFPGQADGATGGTE